MHAFTAEHSLLDIKKVTQLLRMIELIVFNVGFPRNVIKDLILAKDYIEFHAYFQSLINTIHMKLEWVISWSAI